MNIAIKRIYEDKSGDEGNRILVDRLWPRGISKEEADLTGWWKDIAPSDELRKWFDHDTGMWSEFQKRYRNELKDKRDMLEEYLEEIDGRKRITLLYGAKDEDHNQAVVLKEYLEKMD